MKKLTAQDSKIVNPKKDHLPTRGNKNSSIITLRGETQIPLFLKKTQDNTTKRSITDDFGSLSASKKFH